MIMSEVQQRTDDVTSAGVMSLGIMPVTDRFGATPNTGNSVVKKIRTTKGRDHSLFCFGITWVDLK